MKPLNLIMLIIIFIILIIGLAFIFYKQFKEKIELLQNKLDSSENDFKQTIEKKYDLIMKLIEFVESKYKVESKAFEELKKLNKDDLYHTKIEKLFNKCYKEINQIREDNNYKKETKAFKENIVKYEENDLNVISLRTYYNKYTLIYNNLIKKFPYNIISKIKNYKLKSLLEGKELSSSFNNDLEV